jgi:hypothetical protein
MKLGVRIIHIDGGQTRQADPVTIAASARLANRVNVNRGAEVAGTSMTDTKVSTIPSFNCPDPIFPV